MYAAILAGGTGKRFWPLSTSKKPKQFLDITGQGPMLAVTYGRISPMIDPDRIIVLTVSDQAGLVRETLPEIPEENIFSEPAGRNTAPSLAVAAAMIKSRGGDEPVLCCPSDHIIEDEEGFARAVSLGGRLAEEGKKLVTFGITPDRPATGYGYIEAGSPVNIDGSAAESGDTGIFAVKRFHEKPDPQRAMEYIARGGFFWNSGIFMWKPSVFLEAWDRFLPDGRAPLAAIEKALSSSADNGLIEEQYVKMPSISVDYGILERSAEVAVIPVDLGWNDVGSWDSLGEVLASDADGNAVGGRFAGADSRDNIIFNDEGTTAVIGMKDIIVVSSGGNVLVCRRGDSQKVREIVEMLNDDSVEK